MRDQAYYWKCDCPGSVEEKKKVYFSDKHTAGTEAQACQIAADFLNTQPETFTALSVDGNHFTYRFSSNGKAYLLRADNALSEDDYMIAESAVLGLLSDRGLPVPAIYKTETDSKISSLRYQIMDFVDFPTLLSLDKAGTLNRPAMARQFGAFLAELHQIERPGFGFINTITLRTNGVLEGIDTSWEHYFRKCLDKHLSYLHDHQLLGDSVIDRIKAVFDKYQPFLKLEQGALLHRDFAFWNILGTATEIKAVIDWDDAVIGDPADDLGIVACFNDSTFMDELLSAYTERRTVDKTFATRIHFYTLRNMLWKAMIRHYMGYFDKDNDFFLCNNTTNTSLREATLSRIMVALEALEVM